MMINVVNSSNALHYTLPPTGGLTQAAACGLQLASSS